LSILARVGGADRRRRTQMKTLLFAAAIAGLAAFSAAPASAAKYSPPSAGTPHWEWQYHYVGRHPHYEAGWVLVK
jgi:Spy/CpxP family protein refolding chaperone